MKNKKPLLRLITLVNVILMHFTLKFKDSIKGKLFGIKLLGAREPNYMALAKDDVSSIGVG